MSVSSRNGWGFTSQQFPVTKINGAANNVVSNVGAAVSVVAGGAIRLTKLGYRVDLAPDVAVGTASVPVLWRVFVVAGTLPPDLSAFQNQAFPTGAHPEVPALTSAASPLPILFDLWLDFSAGDPGLNEWAELEFADAGPSVAKNDTLNVVVMPINDANLPNAPLGAANAIVSVGAWGTGVVGNPQGGLNNDSNSGSLPRYGVSS